MSVSIPVTQVRCFLKLLCISCFPVVRCSSFTSTKAYTIFSVSSLFLITFPLSAYFYISSLLSHLSLAFLFCLLFLFPGCLCSTIIAAGQDCSDGKKKKRETVIERDQMGVKLKVGNMGREKGGEY